MLIPCNVIFLTGEGGGIQRQGSSGMIGGGIQKQGSSVGSKLESIFKSNASIDLKLIYPFKSRTFLKRGELDDAPAYRVS